MLRVQLMKHHEKDDPIKDLTSASAYAMRATVHGVTKYTPSQLVFAKDMILHTTMEANVELARQRREAAIIGCVTDDRQTHSATQTCLTNTPRDAEPF